jgi:SAM-dependent MidA family methyltransferase
MAQAGGALRFDHFMRTALYTPGLGYYAGDAHKFGRFASDGSDFVTAPELSPLFGRSLARQVAQVCQASAPAVMEFGAGTGQLAVDLLGALGDPCSEYFIVELSASLRRRQRDNIASALPAMLHKVQWLHALPERFSGCIIGNEVLDAMPVRLVVRTEEGWAERCVKMAPEGSVPNGLAWHDQAADAALLALIKGSIPDHAQLPAGYVTEIHEEAQGFMRSMAHMLERGAALFIDYGFPAHEFYHPQRVTGTLVCHARHRMHDKPLLNPGAEDITAHVNFTAMADAAHEAGADIAGYANQARVLMNCGIATLLESAGAPGSMDYVRASANTLKLLNEHEMGELFKVLCISRGLDEPLMAFLHGDRTHAL